MFWSHFFYQGRSRILQISRSSSKCEAGRHGCGGTFEGRVHTVGCDTLGAHAIAVVGHTVLLYTIFWGHDAPYNEGAYATGHGGGARKSGLTSGYPLCAHNDAARIWHDEHHWGGYLYTLHSYGVCKQVPTIGDVTGMGAGCTTTTGGTLGSGTPLTCSAGTYDARPATATIVFVLSAPIRAP